MRWLKRIFGLVVLIGVWVAGWRFVGENQSVVTVHYAVGRVSEIPLWQGLLAAVGIGGLLMGGPLGFMLARARLEGRHYRKRASRLDAEVHALRNLPVTGGDGSTDPGQA